MARSLHTHPCAFQPNGCTNTVPCDGEFSRNYDGHPETVCSVFHNPNGSTDNQACDVCADAYCLACGQVTRWDGHADECSQGVR